MAVRWSQRLRGIKEFELWHGTLEYQTAGTQQRSSFVHAFFFPVRFCDTRETQRHVGQQKQ